MSEQRTAASMDLDGVLFSRFPAQMDLLKPWNYNKSLTIENTFIDRSQRVLQTGPFSRHEKAEVLDHKKRNIKKEGVEMVYQLDVDTIIGNTGRPYNQEMVTMTQERLYDAGITIGEEGTFKYVLFKPEGYSSDESKYWGLQELLEMGYARVFHYDDNAASVKRLAKALPQINFVIVQDLSSGILFSRAEMEKYPNVARIALHKDRAMNINHISDGFGELPHRATYL